MVFTQVRARRAGEWHDVMFSSNGPVKRWQAGSVVLAGSARKRKGAGRVRRRGAHRQVNLRHANHARRIREKARVAKARHERVRRGERSPYDMLYVMDEGDDGGGGVAYAYAPRARRPAAAWMDESQSNHGQQQWR